MDFRQNPLIQDSEDLHEIVVEEVDEGAVETIQLLSSFGVAEDVISALIENGYNLETLKIVERQELEEVVQKPYLADRTKLVHGLNNWRKSLGLTPVSSISPAQEREEVLRRETLTATLLLNKSSKGKQVLAIYNECKILTKAQKKAVTHIIVDEFKDKFGTLTSVELTRLPAELHSIFPTEPEHSWYQPSFKIVDNKRVRLGRLAKGLLHDRNANYKPINRPAPKAGPSEGNSSSSEQSSFSEKAIEEYHQTKTWIRHNQDEWNLVQEK
nr:uncharacterized protein LOC109424330 isoform X2 [Aedes albopictus]